ncbi:MAG: PP2C family protein-serine/threonine phosphatase [Bacteroidales bacterium]
MNILQKLIPTKKNTKEEFQEKEMHVEHIINKIRFIILLVIAFLDIFSSFSDQITLISSVEGYKGICAFVLLLPLIIILHKKTKSDQYHEWIKYLTVSLDLLIVFLIVLPVVNSSNPVLPVTKLEFTLTASLFLAIINSVSVLRLSRAIIGYSALITMLLNATLYLVQDEFIMIGLLTTLFLLFFSIFNGWATDFILQYFSNSRKLSEAYEHLQVAHQKIQQKNEEITKKSEQIENQVGSLEEVHKDLMDSLIYAQKIQEALINHDEIIHPHVKDRFIVFRPREHVSGDFYWASWKDEKLILAVADCTGHGVPGAFMTMLGTSFLNEIVNKENITEPDKILNGLRDSIIRALHQRGKMYEARDGMDMAVIQLDKKSQKMKFAGANNSLCYIPNLAHKEESEIYEFKGDRMPISFHYKMYPFSLLESTYAKGDQFYLYTDGYIDQFGGPKGKKFKLVPFKRMLLKNHKMKMEEQKKILENTMEDWLMDKYQQIDDITILGIQV